MQRLVARDNLLFRLEHSRQPEDVRRVIESLIEWLAAPEQTSLRRALHRQAILTTSLEEFATRLVEGNGHGEGRG